MFYMNPQMSPLDHRGTGNGGTGMERQTSPYLTQLITPLLQEVILQCITK